MKLTGKIETKVSQLTPDTDVTIEVGVTDENNNLSYYRKIVTSAEDYDFIASSYDSSEGMPKEIYIAMAMALGCFDRMEIKLDD